MTEEQLKIAEVELTLEGYKPYYGDKIECSRSCWYSTDTSVHTKPKQCRGDNTIFYNKFAGKSYILICKAHIPSVTNPGWIEYE